MYRECKNIEKALIKHIQDAIEDKYIKLLVDKYTNLLTGDISTILEYLSYNYSKLDPKK